MAWPFRRDKDEEDGVKQREAQSFADAVLRLHAVSEEIDEKMAALLRDVREASPQPRP